MFLFFCWRSLKSTIYMQILLVNLNYFYLCKLASEMRSFILDVKPSYWLLKYFNSFFFLLGWYAGYSCAKKKKISHFPASEVSTSAFVSGLQWLTVKHGLFGIEISSVILFYFIFCFRFALVRASLGHDTYQDRKILIYYRFKNGAQFIISTQCQNDPWLLLSYRTLN